MKYLGKKIHETNQILKYSAFIGNHWVNSSNLGYIKRQIEIERDGE